ncbi:immunoglobulin superfamily containing leucine-rich repeat protein 2 [Rhinatrema bivittatum]|uniref:immunoglobulin superfamily containing leucine-rich repeat protein 2 n=1 Tax=Rhinatrema bivittatum TaxID=194408 RepID=UPI0011277563|nr:immunoglobulin superfamily containing leucine-rich repeat protein 2 [Rhinatrema bivittatum]
MEQLYLICLAAFLGIAHGCPVPCTCTVKYNQHIVDCAYKDLQVVPSRFPTNVTTLNLSANKIASLKKSYFKEVTQVISLWLGRNVVSAIEKGTFAILVQLKNLDISHNQIVDFPWEDLHSLSALQFLKMNNNHMVNLPGDAFHALKELRSLRINNNSFTTIVEGTFDSLRFLSHLQISYNPFACTCNLMWLKNWTETTPISIPEKEHIACFSPENLKATSLSELPNLQCRAPAVQLTYHPNLDNTQLFDGFTLMLHCNASGSPEPTIKWLIQTSGKMVEINDANMETERNDLPIDSAKKNKERFHAFKNGTLVIPRLSKREEGTYTCVATNEVGSNQTSVNVAVAGSQKYPSKPIDDSSASKSQPVDKSPGLKTSINNVINLPKPEGNMKIPPTRRTSYTSLGSEKGEEGNPFHPPPFEKKCGPNAGTQYVSNHGFNQSSDLKQHSFDLGVIALDVSERDAKVQLTPFYTQSEKVHLRTLYLCEDTGKGHSVVHWSTIQEGVNSYWFRNLKPGTNYSVCLTYPGEDCQVQVVFTTKKEIPSLIIIIVVSIFLLGLATIPLLGATCCHLLSKYQGKTYKLIMKTQNPDQMEKHMAADFDPRASYLESEKNYNPSELGEVEMEEEGEGEGEGEEEVGREGSTITESIPESQSKTNQEEFEVGSEYSDRLPLGAEAVTISQEINGNYKDPAP